MMSLRFASLCFALAASAVYADGSARIVVQRSPLAGFTYYNGKVIWSDMRVGDPLTLVREPDNPHDANAIRVEWRGHKLGYVPRRDNAHLARQMDLGAAVGGRITELRKSRNGRNRVSYEITATLEGGSR